MLPTKIAKESVKSIHPCESKEVKSAIKASKEARGEKSCSSKIPKMIPLNNERSTFLKYRARKIAKREGSKERAESSIASP